MESAAIVRSSHCAWPTSTKLQTHALMFGGNVVASPIRRKGTGISCLKVDTTAMAKADEKPQGSVEKTSLRGATFPSGFEALILEVCDETEIAELKLKVGDFEMHLKRNIGATQAPAPSISPVTAPAIPSKPMTEEAPVAPPPLPPKTSSEKFNPFINVSAEKSKKLAALEASGASGYVTVASPSVGVFRRGRTLKGKQQKPICKEGDVIKEGQLIGFVEKLGGDLPVRSDVAGEVLKFLFADGEPLGYGDPFVAVLPSFHGIK